MHMRHGDLLIEMVESVPDGAGEVPAGPRGFVLAEGEATGHAHTVDATPEIKLYQKDGVLYLRVAAEGALVKHEEHAHRVIPRGVARVTPQYGYNAGLVQKTID